MKTSEFRIGNILRDRVTGSLLIVSDLSEADVIFYVVDRNKFPLPDGWQAEPIPLTPEVLVKCGFVKLKLDNGFYYEKYLNNKETFLFSDNILSYGILGVSQYEWSACDHIESLHQLQNLYHALTGEELNYQP